MQKLIALSEENVTEILKYIPEPDITNKLANFFQNFSDFTRLRIIMCLAVCDLCVNDLSVVLSLNQTTISHQLQILKSQDMVSFKRDGKMILYKLKQIQINQVMLGAIDAVC
jgi:ArsR family transcriptional regulator, lead/cadmium/zinc/bismuth-responsive transcriptional repressor